MTLKIVSCKDIRAFLQHRINGTWPAVGFSTAPDTQQIVTQTLNGEEFWQASQTNPIKVPCSTYYVYQGRGFFCTQATYSEDEVRLLILEYCDKERRTFERLKAKFDRNFTNEIVYRRTIIPEDVRVAVWRRDQGQCSRCGNREELEYDHIIPISRGGSNTVRNVELLCEGCNRTKGDKIQ